MRYVLSIIVCLPLGQLANANPFRARVQVQRVKVVEQVNVVKVQQVVVKQVQVVEQVKVAQIVTPVVQVAAYAAYPCPQAVVYPQSLQYGPQASQLPAAQASLDRLTQAVTVMAEQQSQLIQALRAK